MGFTNIYLLVMTNVANWKDPPFLMGKSTILTGQFSIANRNKLPDGGSILKWSNFGMI